MNTLVQQVQAAPILGCFSFIVVGQNGTDKAIPLTWPEQWMHKGAAAVWIQLQMSAARVSGTM